MYLELKEFSEKNEDIPVDISFDGLGGALSIRWGVFVEWVSDFGSFS